MWIKKRTRSGMMYRIYATTGNGQVVVGTGISCHLGDRYDVTLVNNKGEPLEPGWYNLHVEPNDNGTLIVVPGRIQ